MTAAAATPQQIRDRLLQAIDAQSNIHNMVTVLEVISHLERYPITKEALEETRLGKLINDVRKKTKDEDLAKRAKKLLRSWQKLIEPGQTEAPPKGPSGSANGATHPCQADMSPSSVPVTGKPVSELKSRNDLYNSLSPKTEKASNRKRKAEQRDAFYMSTKLSKSSAFERAQNSTPPPANGISGSPEASCNVPDGGLPLSLEWGAAEHADADRQNKIPVNAVKPHPSTPGFVKMPSTSSLLKTSVMQQHIKMDEVTGSARAGHYHPRSPRRPNYSPRSVKQESAGKRPVTYAPRASLSSPPQGSSFLDCSSPVASPSPLPSPSPQPLMPLAHLSQAEKPQSPQLKSSLPCNGPTDVDQQMAESAPDAARGTEAAPHEQRFAPEALKVDGYATPSSSEGKKRKKYRSRDYTVSLSGQPAEDSTKPVRLKDRRLTFDPLTRQIKPLTPKEAGQGEDSPGSPLATPHRTGPLKSEPAPPLPSPFQQTNWKELSRNEIIQSYLNLQSNVLISSGAPSSGAHFFMTEYLKREEHHIKEARKTHVLVPDSAEADLPGVTREVTLADLSRIHRECWQGVNGCYDTKDHWYDWTQCISLDPHGDGSRLDILPYVCLD
ncbi:mediator of RNA polymerase II transcription subunit 26 isoform X2 [Brienomyrus brachyistius]|uniref:mediator of RNA polymerase II transcription subunit 26 isoform X2 n=1 Tax=Brienomyrus brachyistius TaxID=42636 RepID=UPI0020B4307B|nr:mediator of RNA polymerase II transcription subunit 26 isoform X2 [Brienomyrus brachyistius]